MAVMRLIIILFGIRFRYPKNVLFLIAQHGKISLRFGGRDSCVPFGKSKDGLCRPRIFLLHYFNLVH